jgi:HAD superfamily hydrolase (TIGR01549 family)
MSKAAIVCDIDGTLVDTNYQHAISWYRAFRQHEVPVAVWRIHRAIGMGGDQLVAALAGDDVEKEKGEDIRAAEGPLYMQLIEEVEPFAGARDLLEVLAKRDHPVVLSSSAKAQEVDHYLDLLDARDLVTAWTTSGDVEQTKPEPDLVEAALKKAGAESGAGAVMLGDSVWDIAAAQRAGVPTVAVLTGGYSAAELKEAGAVEVCESIGELVDDPDLLQRAAA